VSTINLIRYTTMGLISLVAFSVTTAYAGVTVLPSSVNFTPLQGDSDPSEIVTFKANGDGESNINGCGFTISVRTRSRYPKSICKAGPFPPV